MRDPRRSAVAVTLGAVAWGAADLVCSAVRLPLLWYSPLGRRFMVQLSGTGAELDYFGHLLACAVVGLLSAALAAWWLPKLDDVACRRWELRCVGWLLIVVCLTGALHLTQLWGRIPVPLVSR